MFDKRQNEIFQCYLRISVALIAFGAFFLYEHFQAVDLKKAYYFLSCYSLWIVSYFLLILKKPNLFGEQRVLIAMLADITATAWAMYLAAGLSPLFVSIFLWYIIGYGMRFGVRYAVIATVVTITAWLTLGFASPYWNDNLIHVFGWAIAFILIPSYYFILVKRLHMSRRELEAALKRAEQLANFDSLTRLPNRTFFKTLLDDMQKKHKQITILLIDLDGFKEVNDNLGHSAGDRALIKIAETLKQDFQKDCAVCRLGGDEFMVAIGDRQAQDILTLSNRFLRDIEALGQDFGGISASIGVSSFPQDSEDISRVKKYADQAMYQAKRQGKNRYIVYQSGPATE